MFNKTFIVLLIDLVNLLAGIMSFFLGFADSEEKLPPFNAGKASANEKPEGNIIELNRLERELLDRREKIRALDEPDETLSVLASQLEGELSKLKKGKASEGALGRAKELLSMIDDKLEEKNSPIKELQHKVKKKPVEEGSLEKNEGKFEEPGVTEQEPLPVAGSDEALASEVESPVVDDDLGEIKPVERGVEDGGIGMEEQSISKEEEKIKSEMESKLKEEESKEPEAEEVVEGYFEPGSSQESEEKAKDKEVKEELPPSKEVSEVKESVKPVTASTGSAKDLFDSSVEVLLKAQLENGAIVPCGTEKAYLHIYPRDHGFCALALLKAGKDEQAKKALEFALLHQDKKNGNFPQRWDESGSNTGHKPPQPDATAMVLYAFSQYVLEKNNVDFAERNWDKIEKAIDFIIDSMVSDKNLVFTDSSIHEFPPMERGYEIWTNALCCAVFRELSKVAEKIKVEYEPLAKENVLKDSLLEYMWNSRKNTFVKTIKIKESSSVVVGPDASALALSFFDVFPASDKRVKSTAKLIDEKLWHKAYGGISKNLAFRGVERGGFGASPFFTLLLADYYTKAGDKEKAEKYIKWAASMAFDGLLPEHFATKEDFEGFVSDFSDAGLLNRELMKTINATRSHPDFKNGVAHISEPFSMAHAAFIIAWKNYKKKFLK